MSGIREEHRRDPNPNKYRKGLKTTRRSFRRRGRSFRRRGRGFIRKGMGFRRRGVTFGGTGEAAVQHNPFSRGFWDRKTGSIMSKKVHSTQEHPHVCMNTVGGTHFNVMYSFYTGPTTRVSTLSLHLH